MAKKQEAALATTDDAPQLPDFVDEGRKGYENVVDMTFERLCLLQAMSPEVQQQEGEELAPGMLFRRSTSEVLYTPGSPAIGFCIAFYFKEWVEFGDRDDPNSQIVLARTTDPQSQLAEESRQWVKKTVSKGEVRKVTDVHNFVIIRDGTFHDPILVTAMRSNARYGAGLLNLANGRGEVPIYAGRFLMFTEKETNKRNQTYYVIKYKNPERTPDQYWVTKPMYEAAKTLNEMLAEAHQAGKLGGNYGAEDQGEGGGEPDAEL